MSDIVDELMAIAEEGGFQVAIVLPAKMPRYLTFELVGETTARGLAAAIELRELFNSSADRAQKIYEQFMDLGNVLQNADEPQQIVYIEEHPSVNDPVHLGEEVIFHHDGPEGWSVLTKIEHIENGVIRIDVPAGTYTFSADGGLQRAINRPDTADAATLDTWIRPATFAARSTRLGCEHVSDLPPDQLEKLIRHSPPNGKALQ
ncbi:hypothetical protein [Tardiphaga sp.]|jgi:hypothetical protein|uniref:hypothetical protein n=1 Tax=Tardiphaga sp. TaxID=1926292 RepID=UPI0037D9D234